MVPRRPKKLLNGSESQQPRKAEPIYGAALIKPTRNVSRVEDEPIPKYLGNVRFAPLEPAFNVSLALTHSVRYG